MHATAVTDVNSNKILRFVLKLLLLLLLLKCIDCIVTVAKMQPALYIDSPESCKYVLLYNAL